MSDARHVFRDRWTVTVGAVSGLGFLGVGALLGFAGRWVSTAIWWVFALIQLRSAAYRVVIEPQGVMVLHGFAGARRLAVADIASVDPSLGKGLLRCPRLRLRSGDTVRLTPLQAAPAKTHSQAAEEIGRLLGVALISEYPPPGWYADPVLGHGWRHWDGETWTSLCRDGTRTWADDYRRIERRDAPPTGYPSPETPI